MVLHHQESTFKKTGSHKEIRDFPGVPVVKTPCFHCSGHGFVPGWETKILHATWHSHKKKKKKKERKKSRISALMVTLKFKACHFVKAPPLLQLPGNQQTRKEEGKGGNGTCINVFAGS